MDHRTRSARPGTPVANRAILRSVLGTRRLFSSVYFFEQQRSFPAAPFGVRRRVLRSATPRGGGVERRQAHSFFLLVARARRDARACEARTCPGATGTPLGAPPWRFSAADPRWRLRQWNTGAAATARARPYCLAVGVRTSRGAVSRRSRGTPLLAPSAGRLRRRPLLSQDGESCTINSLRSQYISSLRSRIRSQKPRSGRPRSLFRLDPA